MAEFAKIVKYSNETGGIAFQPYPSTNIDPEAGSEYDAATISGIVFGIFMALLALYSIWQYSRQYTTLLGQFMGQSRHDTEVRIDFDIEIGTVNPRGSERHDDIRVYGDDET